MYCPSNKTPPLRLEPEPVKIVRIALAVAILAAVACVAAQFAATAQSVAVAGSHTGVGR
jgi:hypothetical protein